MEQSRLDVATNYYGMVPHRMSKIRPLATDLRLFDKDLTAWYNHCHSNVVMSENVVYQSVGYSVKFGSS
jgi:hypothetical protein